MSMQAWGGRITSPKAASVQKEGGGMAESISRLPCGELWVQDRAGMLCQPLSSLPLVTLRGIIAAEPRHPNGRINTEPRF